MEMFGIVLVVVVVLLAIVIAMQPKSFRVERSATIAAPPAAVFAQMNDFHRWTNWSPWENIDPNLQRTYSGAAAGKGAVYNWSGAKQVGVGRMEITDSVPNERILIDLRFEKPFKAANTTEFTYKPSGAGTAVTWAMYGPNTLMGRVMHLFGGMDKFVGKDFEKGLAKLATVTKSSR